MTMSVTMNWAAHSGNGPRLYDEFLVPAIFGPFAEDLLDVARLEPGMRVLDVACGTGAVTRAAARRVGPDGRVVGIDAAGGMIAVAEEHASDERAAPIEYLDGAAEELPVPDGSFDVLVCQQGLQFFPDRLAALRSMRAALAPDGRAAVATWTAIEEAKGWTAVADALGLHLGWRAAARMLSPFSLASPRELRRLLEQAGFAAVELRQQTRTATFAPRSAFARTMLMAGPLAHEFAAATEDQREQIVACATDALRECDGGEHELCYPMTTNVALARASGARRRRGISARLRGGA
jgi:ubiquinone/menaquinone biosynthesis C-methylase UbiE